MSTIINKPVDEPDEYCTVVFRLKGGRADANGFVYALACRVEQLKYAEVVTLQMGNLLYQQSPPKPAISHDQECHQSPQGADHEQP